ncbi:MAG: pentapeptide repeat-containing protein [Candidatus Bathyarchaeota archaeon]|nr:pentapeptide repeat-containing protein [Candidatus Bathyarchaeota archaeon]
MSWRELAYIIIIASLYFAVAASLSEDPAQKSGIIYSANEIMELIKSGQNVSCTDATIIGDLKLTGLNLIINNNSLKMVNSSISIINSEIKGNMDFGNAFFQKSLAFEGSTFTGEHVNFRTSEFVSDIDFSGAKFNCMADFSGAKIKGSMAFVKTRWLERAIFDKIMCKEDATFRNDVFQSTLSLKDAVMDGSVDFKDCQFNKEVSLSNSAFKDSANFLGASFSGLAELKGTTFSKPAIFSRSRFDEIADFSEASFANDATFFYARFANTAKFANARFLGETDFRKCGFDGFADFSSASFFGDARFEEAQFSKAARFKDSNFKDNASFHEAYFDRDAYFEGARFGSRLNLTNATFSKLTLPWGTISGNIVYDKATQLSLINNYKNLGWTQDYKNSYYEYREKKRISEPFGLPKLMDTISWIYWGYGTKPYNPLAYIFAFALIFAGIYYGLVHLKHAKVVRKSGHTGCEKCPWAKKEEAQEEANCELSFKEALIFSSRILLLMEKPDDFEIEYAHIGKIVWIERAVFGFLVVPYIDSLLSELQSYFKPP